MGSTGIERLREFIQGMTQVVEQHSNEAEIQAQGAKLLKKLVSQDDWLPASCTQPHPEHYQQYLLHCDPLERFSLISFVWGPGQTTPLHDHTVWGLIGMLRGSEISQHYEIADGSVRPTDRIVLMPGDVAGLTVENDIHKVDNALADEVSISIHMYGANIAAVQRHVFDPENGQIKPFVSGYSAPLVPNLWDRSAVTRAALPIQ